MNNKKPSVYRGLEGPEQALNFRWAGGDDGIRTRGLSLAKAALSQLSYIPTWKVKSRIALLPNRVKNGMKKPLKVHKD